MRDGHYRKARAGGFLIGAFVRLLTGQESIPGVLNQGLAGTVIKKHGEGDHIEYMKVRENSLPLPIEILIQSG